jgi:membrane protease YdiL (CAAX protease family)
VLVGELAGPDVASAKLRELREKIADSSHVQDDHVLQAMDILERLYANYVAGRLNGPSVDAEERASLRGTLGWFGDLALAPNGGDNTEARQALLTSALAVFWVFMVVIVGGGLVALAGFVGLITLAFLALSGRVQDGVVTGSAHGGIYAETFALWMVVFLLLGFAPLFLRVEGSELLVTGAATLASLVVLAWPVVRGGISWRQVREDIGLTAGRRPALEPLLGPAGYAMSMPLLAVGVVLTLILITLQGALGSMWGAVVPADEFSPAGFPAHPIIEFLAGPGWWGKAQVLFLGSVVAPIVEEIMFRGVLYRHMREATQRWAFLLSFVVSALVVSFVFAVIHPQGFVAVPALMSLALGFTILREWRGSLISCMIAHGMNNALVMSLATFVFNI